MKQKAFLIIFKGLLFNNAFFLKTEIPTLMLKLLNTSKTCCKIQRLISYNLMTKKVADKVPLTIQRPNEKSYRGTGKLEMNFP